MFMEVTNIHHITSTKRSTAYFSSAQCKIYWPDSLPFIPNFLSFLQKNINLYNSLKWTPKNASRTRPVHFNRINSFVSFTINAEMILQYWRSIRFSSRWTIITKPILIFSTYSWAIKILFAISLTYVFYCMGSLFVYIYIIIRK